MVTVSVLGLPLMSWSCAPLPPLGHIWDVMLVWRNGNTEKMSVLCTMIMVHKGMSSYRSVDCIRLWSCLVYLYVFRAPLSSWCYMYIIIFFPYILLVSWAWWDWPLTWLTNHCPSVLWHCWLGHLTRKIVSEMTYDVSSETLKLYYTIRIAPQRLMIQRRSEDTELNQAWSKSDPVDLPVRTARTFAHHYNGTQYCSTETVLLRFPFIQNNITF